MQSAIDYLVSAGGEFVEFFFESSRTHSILIEDSRVERISSGTDEGFGLRIVSDERTAYGFSNKLGPDEMYRLGRDVLESLERGRGESIALGRLERSRTAGLVRPAVSVPMEEKVALVYAADRAARAVGEEISQVQITYSDKVQSIQIYNNEGTAVDDERHYALFFVKAIATDGTDLQTAYRSLGGTVGFEIFDSGRPVELAAEAGESALMVLHARRSPAGTMAVVLGSQAGGTMIHEAIGHGLEGDTAEKGLSIYSGKIGEPVASAQITVIDDATMVGKRGSFSFDDEGVPARRTVAVEEGILKGYLLDRMTAKKLGSVSTGNGRRQSFRHRPIVRMSNTMIAPGTHDPQEIVASVDYGLCVLRMGGGQVDTSSGDFVFKANEAYLIEGGKMTEPVRGATLIGNGPAILHTIDMVGNDIGFDIGTCGKDGQHVPVADAQPTLRIPAITVGGEV
ncbi:MAG: TldD/PmbA family protein [bacterium]|nr:MAG: TldD/PmbA family protein [bacterium]